MAITNDSQQWSILEKLLLAQCVYKFGEDNWPLISKTLRQNVLTDRSQEFYNQKNCSLEYFTMIEELESARRLAAAANVNSSAQEMPPVVKLAKQLYLERMEELKAQIKADEESFRKLVTEIDEIRSGKWDAKLKELFPEVSEPTPMEIINDSQVPDDNLLSAAGTDVTPHHASAVPDITVPTSEEKIDIKTEVEEKLLDSRTPEASSLVSEAAQIIVDSNVNDTSLESNTILADATSLLAANSSVDEKVNTIATPEVNETNVPDITSTGPTPEGVTEDVTESDIVVEEQTSFIPQEPSEMVEENKIMTESDAHAEETEILAPTAEVTPAVTPKDDTEVKHDISTKRKPVDSDMMSVDNSPKRARTQSRSPSVVAEPATDIMSPVIETPQMETPETEVVDSTIETPERRPETPVVMAAVEEMQDIDHIARVPDTPKALKGPSSRELEQRQKSWLKNINLLWSEISNHKNGAMFMNPIKENIAPRYYEIVKRPMDLKQIKQRIRDGTIRNTLEFERDILLMLTNSLIYNKEGTEVYQMALEMLEDVQEQIRVFKTADAYSSAGNGPKDTSHGLRRRSILNHFYLLRSVGKGAFGKVRVVQHKSTKQLYALKYINKTKCIKMRAVDNIISERRLLEQIDYSLIVNLRYAFQDDENLFMVLDLMLGGDLRFHLERVGTLPEDQVRFYAAELALGLNYLHRRRIVHRDLKPDNILLDENGHAHLTDFNIAVHYSDKKPLTAVAGSMAYMAPEVLQKKGYFSSVDWWSLGVVLFELLFGKRPFRGKTNEALTKAIIGEPAKYPENVYELVSPQCLDFLQGLLTRDPSQRIGVDGGFEKIRSHGWFKGIDWHAMERKELKPPFTPDSKRANFDPSHELEEILLEDNPLKVRKRSKPVASNAGGSIKSQISQNHDQSPEMQIMDDKFLTYDYTKPHENAMRQQEFEQRRWAHKSGTDNRVTRISDETRYSQPTTRSYKSNVLDQINSKPATPISAGDILKMDELARMARMSSGHGQSTESEWRPPSGILSPSSMESKSYIRPGPTTAHSSPTVQRWDNYNPPDTGRSSPSVKNGVRRYSDPAYADDHDPFIDHPASPGKAPYGSERSSNEQPGYSSAYYRRRLSDESGPYPPSPIPSETGLLKGHGYAVDQSQQSYGVKNAFPMPPPQQPPPPIPSSQPVYRPHRISSRPSREKLPMVLPPQQAPMPSSQGTPGVPPRQLPPTAPIPPVPSSTAAKPRPTYNPNMGRANMMPGPPPQSAPPPIPVLPPLPNDRM
ncbi:hypothetical protein BC943DRAFT_359373 [Umbelopsis sp. AD052]|nr:hypothetical protein BC943DRAFT_359373 [Umbelopsis sp. AD052]